ncbi:MAG: nucleotidyltransferase domain-containing protein [Spirochaetes bacterium]|nr:nucleotidyltransferase domain-containing protein [Spirochaetota bacterium]
MIRSKKLTPYEEQLISSFVEYISSFNQVTSVIVYGSRSKGQSNEYSDVDVAIVVEQTSDVKKLEKIIEQWNIDVSPEILLHFLVIDTNGLHTVAIGKEILEGDIVWLRQRRD